MRMVKYNHDMRMYVYIYIMIVFIEWLYSGSIIIGNNTMGNLLITQYLFFLHGYIVIFNG